MEFLYLIIGVLVFFKVDCNPLTELTTNSDLVTTQSDEISEITTEVLTTTPSEVIEYTTISDHIITTDLVENTNCSHCLDTKYLNHYFAKGCEPILDSNHCNGCPKRFDCSRKLNITLRNNECLYSGNKYKIGESIPVSNPCRVCQCGYGYDHTTDSGDTIPFTTIHCIEIECPEHFSVHSSPLLGLEKDFERVHNCYHTYEPSKCCAVGKKCLGLDPIVKENVCEYNAKTYQIGEKIYLNEDKCKVCICDHNWNSSLTVNNSGCYSVQCNLELDRQLLDGCVPIYHEKTCCPIDYYCPEKEQPFSEELEKCKQPIDSGPCTGTFKRFYHDIRDGHCHSFVYSGCGGNDNNFEEIDDCQQNCVKSESNKTIDKSSESENPENNEFCQLNGDKYPIGHRLDIGQRCVDCICQIPPDFTCIHKACPIAPINQCKVTYSQSSCCPIIDCNYNKTNNLLFDAQSCPTPMCQTKCRLETYPDRCPTCVCETNEPNIADQEVSEYDTSDDV